MSKSKAQSPMLPITPNVCAQYGHLVPKVSYYSRGCKSLIGKLVKPVSKPQAGFPWGVQWRKRDYKIRYWRTGSTYRGMIEWVSKHIFATPLANKLYCVDVSGIGGKNMPLSRLAGQALGRSWNRLGFYAPRSQRSTELTPKSEVIVATGNKPWNTGKSY